MATPSEVNAVLRAFTDADFFDAANTGPGWGPGKSIALLSRREAPSVSSDVLWGFQSTGDGTGWLVWSNAGFWTVSAGGVPVSTGISADDPAGTLVGLAITWTAAGVLRVSRRGAAPVAVPIAGWIAPSASAQHLIGRWGGGGSPADGLALAAASAWDAELTDAQLQSASAAGYHIADPTGAPARVFDWDAGRDWDGSSTTSTSQGSSPVTFTVTGSPVREVV